MKIKNWKLKIFIDWPLVGLFLFCFLALIASLSIMFTKGILVKTRMPFVNYSKIEEKDERTFLWKDNELPLPVIIDNMKDAWPPAGLEFARVVFEAPVEAGITRLLAVFGSDEEEDFEIGPVRSARPYLADWAEEFGTILAHVGGSPAALDQLKASKIYNLDEFRYGGKYFSRQRDRFAPHNTFIKLSSLNKFFNKVRKKEDAQFNKWLTAPASVAPGEIAAISIPYPEPYGLRWEYQRGANDYWRFTNDKPFNTEQGKQIRAKNIVVMKTEITIIDSLSRRRIETKGGGEALIFKDGRVAIGKWTKKDGFTKFYDGGGSEIVFNPGPIWVEVVSERTNINY